MDFFKLFEKYKKEISSNPDIDCKKFVKKHGVLDDSADAMITSLNLMLENERNSERNSERNTNEKNIDKKEIGISQAIPEESKYENGDLVAKVNVETDSQQNIIDPTITEIPVTENCTDSDLIKNSEDPIDILSNKSNWSELTSTSNKYKIYEVIQEDNDVSIIGSVIIEGKHTPTKWNMFGINGEHNIMFKGNYKLGKPIVVSNLEHEIYARVFNKYSNNKIATFDLLSKSKNTTDNLVNLFDFSLPWEIYTSIVDNINK